VSVVPVPPDEDRRLRLLRSLQILDTPSEPVFDGAVQAATRLLGAPIAFVALVDAERQWFKARVGFDPPETSRQVAFSAWAIVQPDQVLEVPDLAADRRFAHNPLVVGPPRARFYAGVPLEVAPGLAVGTLSVIDRRPRRLTTARKEGLVALGQLVTEALRRRLDRLEVRERDRALRLLRSEVSDLLVADPVTGLPNRKKLEAGVALLLQSGRAPSLAAIAIGIDRFRQVNEAFGRASGDRLLQMVAERLRAATPPRAVLGRLEGPRFALLTEDLDDASLVSVARSVLFALERPFFDPSAWDRPISLRARAGIAVQLSGGRTDCVLEEAFLALEGAAKRDQAVGLFRPELRTQVRERIVAEHDLQDVLRSGRVEVAFQPIVTLPRLETIGSESLLRVGAPSLARLPVPAVIDLADEAGLLRELGQAVLRRSLAHLASIARQPERHGMLQSHPLVTVNLSKADLLDAGLVADVKTALDEAGLGAERLVVEVTEGQLLSDRERAATTLMALRELGVGVALDDFGTGYSSLAYLATLPVDIVKVDRTFVAGATSPAARRLLASVPRVAHDLGIRAVAEGIETPEELRMVSALGFDFAQGYLTGRPSVPGDVAARLRSGAPPSLDGLVEVVRLARRPRHHPRRPARPSGSR
jgi:diguanylate cyclase (GGDEF)-like protein